MKYPSFFRKEIKFYKDAWILVILVLVFILLRMPSLVEPHWYGDEGIYQVIGKALTSGRILYQDIWDNKPPILYFIYALFNGDQFLTRAFSLLVGVFSVVSFYSLAKMLFEKSKSIIIATSIYVIFLGSPIIEGNIANAENFMHLPIVLSAIFVLKFHKGKRLRYLFIAGLLLSIAFMTKIVAIFEFLAFLVFIFVVHKEHLFNGKLKDLVDFAKYRKEALYISGFLIFPIIFSLYFVVVGAFPDFLSGVLSENIDYVGVENSFIFPMGILLFKAIVALVLLSILLYKRKSFSDKNLFLYLWLIFAMFSTFFSQRPYLHYMLMLSLPFAFFVGSIFETSKNRVLKIVAVLAIAIIVYMNFGIYKKNIAYYQNYIAFMLFDKKIDDYRSFFDSNTLRDYELARFIGSFANGKDEDVFLWSDSGQIYALSDTLPPGKYIVAYHITYYNNAVTYMMDQVEKTEPKYIIQTKESPEFRKFLPSYILKYKIKDASIYEREN